MKKTERVRRQARRRFLEQMFLEQNGFCHFCREKCAIVGYINQDDIVSLSCTVVWRVDDAVLFAKVATVDHLVPLRDGGTNDRSNLVMACADCNKDRTAQKKALGDAMSVCQECGDLLMTGRYKTCKRCFVVATTSWLLKHGWCEIPSETDSNHTRFVDPTDGSVHILHMAFERTKKRLGLKGHSYDKILED